MLKPLLTDGAEIRKAIEDNLRERHPGETLNLSPGTVLGKMIDKIVETELRLAKEFQEIWNNCNLGD